MNKQDYKEQMGNLLNENSKLKKQLLELTMENAELKDMVLDNGGDYTPTDEWEVGIDADYEEDKQLKLFNEI